MMCFSCTQSHAQAAEAAAGRDAAVQELEEAQESLYGQVGELKQQARSPKHGFRVDIGT